MLRALRPPSSRLVALALLIAITQTACAHDGAIQTGPAGADSLAPPPYAFDRPVALFYLPGALTEISGLTVLDDRTLGAIQDEKGNLYLIDMATGKVEEKRDFGKNLDYEGVERVGEAVWILQSDGDLFEITDWRDDDLDADKHDTKLDRDYDTEGLAYDAAQHRLLIACKEYAGNDLDPYKAIYAFDLARKELLDDPVYLIDIEAFSQRMYPRDDLNAKVRKAVRPFMDMSGFKPSALAVHPLTDEVYVLSSAQPALVVLSSCVSSPQRRIAAPSPRTTTGLLG